MNYKLLKYLFLLLINGLPVLTYSQIPIEQPGMESKVYKTIGDINLKLYIFQPSGRKDGERLPAIVFFFGGGFAGGKVTQFEPQCKYLVERGMVAVLADYRVKNRHGVTPFECVADAKSAIRWVRTHASELGVDENRIAAGGGSAGGHLAACTALIKEYDDKNEDLNVSSVPNALVLFNPVLDLPEAFKNTPGEIANDWVNKASEISPIHHVISGAPPTIIFHGTSDLSVPFQQAINFLGKMKKYGNRCDVVPYEGRDHGFFNYYGGDNPDFLSTMEFMVKFLTSIGYIKSDSIQV
ncbi:MAG TPA: alpha/beta hydrolase [Bacteroidales bacterium]|nr:alpha/beta hydrolase [Bacteroidales bacterium]